SLSDAREAAVQAVGRGDLATAETLARHLLAADPQDPLARQVLATVALRKGDLPRARAEARAAHANARTDRQRHEAAKLAAIIADAEGRDLALRWWLRAAGEDSPTAQERKLAARALAHVRDRSPWALRFGVSVSPSNNVNGGADSPFTIVDGHPELGQGLTDADGRALSGMVGKLNADLSWRLARSDRAQTRLSFGLDLKRVHITDHTDNLKGSDLSSDTVSLGMDHERLDAGGRGRWDFGADLGLSRDGEDSSREISARLGRSLALTERAMISFSASWTVEQENRNDRVTRLPQLTISSEHHLAGGARLGFALTGYDAQTSNSQRKRHGGLVQVSYAPGKPLGPFDISGALGLSFADYPDYSVPLGPGIGRQDQTVFGQVTLVARDLSWQGFSPQLTLRASRSDSNISKFDTLETGIVLGLKSQF
ncbi:MAG: DUF560 domain-containing protein, partial [Gemmobacter sp.]|uniref:surface lipoprotein assembly modifier n=1 Tax=Gemmobacter sp. TaxID=1898957 RepID=UPI001A3704FC